ncbi:hypothetical protein [Parasphingopyxis sp.]|uniref:hypothetical protein n=1 Tax=Parasphingopyxis sp. TaxID=1920299 RepID=UPI00260B8BAC|nr:hypothetical protein [Parasphingopyxis sp.]
MAIMMPWGRVGSNLLLSMIRTAFPSSETRAVNEPFKRGMNAEQQIDLFKKFYRRRDAEERLIIAKYSVRLIADKAALARQFSEHGVRLVRQRRANLVKAAVSQLRGKLYADLSEKQSGRRRWGVPAKERPLPPVALDPKRFVEVLRGMVSSDEELMRFAPDCPILDIEYEQISEGPEQVFSDLLDWLEVVPQRAPEIIFAKATPDDLTQAVPNLEALRDAANAAGFEQFDAMFDG